MFKHKSLSMILGLLIHIMIPFITALFSQPLADGKSKFLGNVIYNGNSIRSDFTKYWNQVTPENAGKWASVEPSRDGYNWTPLDNIYNYARSNHFPYKHHALVWGNQYPSWITSLDSSSQREEVEEWIRLVGERYPDMDFIDVVNEPFNAPPPFKDALGGSGETGWDWVITSFEWAREYCDSDVKLILNEYNVLHDNSRTNNYIGIITLLQERGLIDAIGIQGHYFEFKSYAGGSPSYTYSVSTIKSNLDKLATTGLPIYISEFDINEPDDNIQLQNYQTYFPLFWENPAVKGITLWGYAQYEIWKVNSYLITDRRKERPAMQWLRSYLLSPFKPVLITPVSTTNELLSPTLVWHPSDAAETYHIQVATNRIFSPTLIDSTVADTLLVLNNLDENKMYYWRVNASNDHGSSDYTAFASFVTELSTGITESREIVTEFALHQNYPNPFNPTTKIKYSVPEIGFISLKVFNNLGKEITTLYEGMQQAGPFEVIFNGVGLASGVYFYQLKSDTFVEFKKFILID